MLQEVYDLTPNKSLAQGKNIIAAIPGINSTATPCELMECIYCLDNNYCGRAYPPRNDDGYCKDFVSIND